ncbi:spindle pole body component alp14 [Phakopsora pachyrhizi]|uniref:Spindle pole body component alp14 n=1 Tax=Phakopsora pachyrhizi TaxID=170000 RepID=A0AAV0BHG9_PHAPC|nr:spindle pole body component alp14 [Phakopsora pachyrhizi]KAI8453774.1 spindle pole body component alp14 [Phakopsora pachyrhizi]CAH7684994.1 spindle pole body component alp14 [Phakopsora pachyrhizi]
MAEDQDEWQKLPLPDKLNHKLWKARLEAYETLAKQFELAESEDDDVFTDWNRNYEWPRKAVTDSNAVAQEKGVLLLSTYIRLAGRAGVKCRSDCITPLVEKCMATNARKVTKEAATECILGWALTEADIDKAENIVNPILEGLSSKQPKVVAGAVASLSALISAFGVKVINIKPVLKSLPKIFAHADKGVRSEGTILVQTLYRFLGAALEPSLSELKPVQVKELHESFAALDAEGNGKGTGTPTRETASQRRERQQREAQAALEGALNEKEGVEGSEEPNQAAPEEEEAEELDPYDLADPVAVLDRLPSGLYEHLSSSKWKERKEEALDPLLAVLKPAIKIKADYYDELVKALAGRMSDANILCVIGAANCLECLAKGLRSDFGKYRSYMLVPVLEKFKEKKVNVVEALCNCLDAMAVTVTLSDLAEDIVTFSKHKNPQVKEQTMKFLVRCLCNTENQIPKTEVKSFSDVMLGGLEDAVVPVREASAEGLGTLMKLVGKATFAPIIQGLDDLRKAKVDEYFEKAVVKYKPPKAKPKTAQPSKPTAKPLAKSKSSTKPPPVSNSSKAAADENDTTSSPSLPAKPLPKAPPKKPTGPTSTAAIKKPPVASASAAPGKAPPKIIEEVKYKFSQEDAESRAPDCLEASFIEGVGNSLWKTRLSALDDLLSWIPEHKEDFEAEVAVRYLNKKPGPKESNFQVWQRVFAVLQAMCSQCPSFSKACMALTIPACIEKYGDIKIKEASCNTLIAYAEKSSLGFVLSHAFEPISKQKAVKIQAESFLFIEMVLSEFGITSVPVRDLIECLKTGLKSVNAAVRTNATKALVMTKICIGADISNFLQDLNPQLLSTIETEFLKREGEKPPVPTRKCADILNAGGGEAGNSKGKGKASGDPLDELFPRVDLERLIASSTIKACDDAAWKTRKEALETIQGILDQNKRLKSNIGSDLMASLKMRLGDANKVVQSLALDVISRIAVGMGKPFDRNARTIASSILNILADKNAGARNNALSTLTSIADACGLDCLISSIGTALEVAKPELRTSAISWLVERINSLDGAVGLDMTSFASPIISCLEDRSSEVRKGATALLPAIIQSVGIDLLLDQTSNLKPASRNSVVPIIEACRPVTAPKASAPVKALSKLGNRGTAAANKISRPPSVASTYQRPSTPSQDERKSKLGPRKSVVSHTSKYPSSQSPLASPAPPNTASEAPFRSGDPKAKTARASKETGPLKWKIDGAVRKDQIEQLYMQMVPQVSSELLNQLFSKDHHCEKDFLAGLSVIESWTSDPSSSAESADLEESDVRDRLLANSDLVFKYLTIRLHDTNTTIIMKCLDIVEQYISVLQLEGYRLSDYEATALLPSLINRCGDSKEVLRNRVRTIFKSICAVYPFSKVFQSLLEHGLKSKNARIRAECAEELSALFQRHGLGVCQPAKALPQIAALISDRDSAVRNSALSALASAYASAGDVILKLVGNLSGKDQDMLNERLKRTEAPSSPRGGSVAPDVPSSPPRVAAVSRLGGTGLRKSSLVSAQGAESENNGFSKSISRRPSSSLRLSSPSAPLKTKIQPPSALPSRSSIASAARRNSLASPGSTSIVKTNSQTSLRPPSNRTSGQLPTIESESSIVPVSDILSSDDIRSTDALKAVQADIAQRPDLLVPGADTLIDAIATQMKVSFEHLDASTPSLTLRLCKHLMQTLSTFFDRTQLATAVSTDSLVAILAQLTQRLQETADNPVSEHITSLSKVLNMVLIRIFHNADRTACFGALFTVLKMTTIDMREIEDEVELGHRAKYAELIIQCLWKVSKTVKESLEDGTLDVSILLRDIDNFLVAIPPAEWRRRANDNVPLADMPLRTVKTILQQVVTIYGDGVYDAVSALKNPQDTFVYQYLFRLLNNSRVAGGNSHPSQPLTRPASARSNFPSTLPESISSNQTLSPPTGSPKPDPKHISKSSLLGTESLAEAELNNQLTEAFAKIGSPTESKKGIAELYQILKVHPEANSKVDKWISATGTYFQAYLRRALNNLRAEDPDSMDASPPRAFVGGESTSRPSTALASVSPSNSNSGKEGVMSRSSRTVSQDVDLNRLQSLFGFAVKNNSNGANQSHTTVG